MNFNFEDLNYLYIGLLKSCELGLVEIEQSEETNYHRIEMTRMDWILCNAERITNAFAIRFSQAKNYWGTLSHFGIFDALEKGRLLAVGNLQQKTEINENHIIEFGPGRMTIDLNVFELGAI